MLSEVFAQGQVGGGVGREVGRTVAIHKAGAEIDAAGGNELLSNMCLCLSMITLDTRCPNVNISERKRLVVYNIFVFLNGLVWVNEVGITQL